MSNYWKDHYDRISLEHGDELLKQVGKTVNGERVADDQIKLIIESVTSALEINENDILIDLCCGNGVLTRKIAPRALNVVGIDFSKGLIDEANKHSRLDNITYLQHDVLSLPGQFFSGKRKVLMYEAMQHFTQDDFHALLQALTGLDSGSIVLFGSVPDKARLRNYYDTDEKYSFFQQRESEGRPHMGKWWMTNEIEIIAARSRFQTQFLPQPSTLYTSHYRFNLLLKK